jgi:hypothetical protein
MRKARTGKVHALQAQPMEFGHSIRLRELESADPVTAAYLRIRHLQTPDVDSTVMPPEG